MVLGHVSIIDTFNPDRVAGFLERDDWSGLWSYLETVLASLNPLSMNVNLQSELNDEVRKKHVLSFGKILGELIEAFLSDPKSKLPDKNFLALMPYHETFHGLLSLFGMENTDEIVTAILNSARELSDTQQKKLALLLSMRTKLDIVKVIKRIDTKYRVMAVTCYLSYLKIVDDETHNNKVTLLQLGYDLEKAYTDFQHLRIAHSVYFQCSYLDYPDKHKIKKSINIATQRFLQGKQRDFKKLKSTAPEVLPDIEIDPSKPKLAVLMDFMRHGHAMLRVWGPWINALRSTFNVVIFVSAELCDQGLEKDYPNIVTFMNIGEMVQVFHSYNPDMLIMPSIGMGPFSIFAANMRLAPVQMMGLGHPATTMSSYLDFVYGDPHGYDERAFPTDKFVADAIPFRFTQRLAREKFEELAQQNDQPKTERQINVSIVGAVQKMAAPFINLLKELETESDFDITFTFHLDSLGFDSLYLQRYFQNKFKSVRFNGWQKYEDYIQSIASADIVLNPFPFGNTNTIIDTLLLGKPCIGLYGPEPAAKAESYVLEILGLNDGFVAKDKEDYKQKFQHFSSRILSGDKQFFNTQNVFERLYQKEKIGDFGQTVKWVYDHHSELLASKDKFFLINELMDKE